MLDSTKRTDIPTNTVVRVAHVQDLGMICRHTRHVAPQTQPMAQMVNEVGCPSLRRIQIDHGLINLLPTGSGHHQRA